MKIVTYPADILRQKTIPVVNFDKIQDLAQNMLNLMEKSNGVGLAAPQIGENLSLFVVSVDGKANNGLVFVNPVITERFGEEVEKLEGCLSLPGISVPVNRFSTIRVKTTDIKGELISFMAGGLLARIIQHEYDHLSGILILDYIKPE